MAAISVRDLDEKVRDGLRLRAARHGRSMEAEIREILTQAVAAADREPSLAHALVSRFGALGGVELALPACEEMPQAPALRR